MAMGAAAAGSAITMAAAAEMIMAQSIVAAANIRASGYSEIAKSIAETGVNISKSFQSLLSSSSARGG